MKGHRPIKERTKKGVEVQVSERAVARLALMGKPCLAQPHPSGRRTRKVRRRKVDLAYAKQVSFNAQLFPVLSGNYVGHAAMMHDIHRGENDWRETYRERIRAEQEEGTTRNEQEYRGVDTRGWQEFQHRSW